MSNIKTLVNQYFPSNLTHYETGIVRLPDHRPYAEKKKEFTGILCRHVNNGDGAVFTPNFEDEYLITYGTPVMGLHRWILRELELFEDWEDIKDEVEETWKIKISDIPELSDLIPWPKVKIYEDYSTWRYFCNEAYDLLSESLAESLKLPPEARNKKSIYSRKKRVTFPQFCEIMSGIVPEDDYEHYFFSCQEHEYGEDADEEDDDDDDYYDDDDYENDEYGTTLITTSGIVSGMLEIEEEEHRITYNLDLDDNFKMSVGYANLLKSIIKKYKKNIGPVVELPDIGVTLWELPKKN